MDVASESWRSVVGWKWNYEIALYLVDVGFSVHVRSPFTLGLVRRLIVGIRNLDPKSVGIKFTQNFLYCWIINLKFIDYNNKIIIIIFL